MSDPEADRPTRRMGYVIPITDEILADSEAAWVAFHRYSQMTPDELREARQKATVDRAETRHLAPSVELTLDGLLDALGWSQEYATHLMQPYCTCDWGSDGWDLCQHAYDLDLEP